MEQHRVGQSLDRKARRESNPSNSVWPPPWLPPLAVAVVMILWPLVGFGAWQAWATSKNRIEDWLPASFPETQNLYTFADRFGSDEFLMISWPGFGLNDSRAASLQKLLLEPNDDGKTLFARADSGQAVLDSLIRDQRMTETQARDRMAGVFVGADGKQTCVVALISPEGIKERKAAIDWAWHATIQTTNLPKEDIHIAGTTADSVAIDEASNTNLLELNSLSWLVCIAVLFISLKNFWLVATLFFIALFNQQLALAFIYASGGHVDSVQLLVANLAFVLTISAGLHYLGYFREAERDGSKSPAWDSLRQAFLPSMLAATTTSLGFIALCTSEIVPIRSFGFYSAILVPINTIIVLLLLSIHVQWTTKRNWRWKTIITRSRNAIRHSENLPSTDHRWTDSFLKALGLNPLLVLSLWFLVTLLAGFGVTKLQTSVGTHKLLPPDSKLLSDYAWLERNVGALVPIELVLQFPVSEPNAPLTFLNNLRAIQRLRNELLSIPDIESTWSVLNFLPPLPPDGGIQNTARKAIIGKVAQESRSRFIEMRLLYENHDEQYWRLSGRVAGSTISNYELVLNEVAQAIDRFNADPAFEKIPVEVSGGVPFIYRTQRQLLVDLLSSFMSAFIMIAASMAILFRSLTAGLLTMLPNVTPSALVFGIMGWLNMEVEIGTVLTASVMMGVCVDDTLHLVSHFRALRRKGLPHKEAVGEAIRNCGGAMIQTAFVCGLGMLAFAFSPFMPVARFAWLTFTLLMVGLISDLILTPALLLSPLHHMFYWESRGKKISGSVEVREISP